MVPFLKNPGFNSADRHYPTAIHEVILPVVSILDISNEGQEKYCRRVTGESVPLDLTILRFHKSHAYGVCTIDLIDWRFALRRCLLTERYGSGNMRDLKRYCIYISHCVGGSKLTFSQGLELTLRMICKASFKGIAPSSRVG